MSTGAYSDVKTPVMPSDDSADSRSVAAELTTSEDLAMEKRVLRKTDMVVLPMVCTIPNNF